MIAKLTMPDGRTSWVELTDDYQIIGVDDPSISFAEAQHQVNAIVAEASVEE